MVSTSGIQRFFPHFLPRNLRKFSESEEDGRDAGPSRDD